MVEQKTDFDSLSRRTLLPQESYSDVARGPSHKEEAPGVTKTEQSSPERERDRGGERMKRGEQSKENVPGWLRANLQTWP